MKVILEPTDRVVHLEMHGLDCRIWSGHTEEGVPIYFLVARVAVPANLEDTAYIQIESVLDARRDLDEVSRAMTEQLPLVPPGSAEP